LVGVFIKLNFFIKVVYSYRKLSIEKMDFNIPEFIRTSTTFLTFNPNIDFLEGVSEEFRNFDTNISSSTDLYRVMNLLNYWNIKEIPFEILDTIRSKKYDNEILKDMDLYKEISLFIFDTHEEMLCKLITNNDLKFIPYALHIKNSFYETNFDSKKDLNISFCIGINDVTFSNGAPFKDSYELLSHYQFKMPCLCLQGSYNFMPGKYSIIYWVCEDNLISSDIKCTGAVCILRGFEEPFKKVIVKMFKISSFLSDAKKNKLCKYNDNIINSFIIWAYTYISLGIYLREMNYMKFNVNMNKDNVKENILIMKERQNSKGYKSLLYEIATCEDWLEFL
jgi:hypothetical protein